LGTLPRRQSFGSVSGIQQEGNNLQKEDVPIILCMGHSDAVSPEMARTAGIRQFLMNPPFRHELAEASRRGLDAKTDE